MIKNKEFSFLISSSLPNPSHSPPAHRLIGHTSGFVFGDI